MTPEPIGANYLSAETKKCYEDILASYTNIYNNAYVHCNGNVDCTNRLKEDMTRLILAYRNEYDFTAFNAWASTRIL